MNTQPLLNPYYSSGALSVIPPQSILIPSGSRYIAIPTDHLMCMEASGNYTFIYTIDGRKYLVSKTLKSYVALLEGLSFVRVHKSWLINPKYLQGFCEYERSLQMKGGKEIAISRRRVREVTELLAPLVKKG
ncbi:MAG: LytTR family DNA-binding domain-containing protein [Spirosomataceae bacterium]